MLNAFSKNLIPINKFSGIGLHSGKISRVKIIPAEENTGIVFKRVDLDDRNLIEANYKNVSSAVLCTTIKNEYGIKSFKHRTLDGSILHGGNRQCYC